MREFVIAKFYRTPEFLALNAEWSKKLKENGFGDAENNHPTNPYLNEWESVYFQIRYHPQDFEAKRRYFELASQFLHTYRFKKSIERKIWSLHAEGVSVRVSAVRLGIDRNKVHNTILALRKIMLRRNNKDDE